MEPSTEPATPKQTARSIVTEEALKVSPEILGLPLAAPWRRAAAISVDGILIAILARNAGFLFGLAVALVLFHVSRREAPGAGYIRRSFRFMFRLGGAVTLFVVAFIFWGSIGERFGGDEGGSGGGVSVEVSDIGETSASLGLTGVDAARFVTGVVALHRAEDEEEAREATESILERMRREGVVGADARAAVRELAGDVEEKPWMQAGVETVLAEHEAAEVLATGVMPPDSAGEPATDSAVVAYAAALAAADSAVADSLRPAVVTALSADTVRVLDGRIAELGVREDELEAEVGELRTELEEGPGIMSFLRSVVDDLGLGFGWGGLYFTATTALWRGRTPGKRLFGIRVILLTGKPIGWWASFERFGGYAAGVATGLLGFLQIFWDNNRQATHDKIAGTAVIRE